MSLVEGPVWGKYPEVGDTVYVDFGDSFYAHPEIMDGIVETVDPLHITIDGTKFQWCTIAHLEVIEDQ